MALSLSNFLYALHILLIPLASAATREYNFDVGWVTRNPDGQHPRPVIGINGEWPIPRIEADVGDRLIVNMKNSLGNESTTIHFHGLYQNGTSFMDGAAQCTQCPVPPGSTFTYNFTVSGDQVTWYGLLTRQD
jgi:iron transport multicopper oxidase